MFRLFQHDNIDIRYNIDNKISSFSFTILWAQKVRVAHTKHARSNCNYPQKHIPCVAILHCCHSWKRKPTMTFWLGIPCKVGTIIRSNLQHMQLTVSLGSIIQFHIENQSINYHLTVILHRLSKNFKISFCKVPLEMW